MIPDLTLSDDGTMDTVFHCSDCGEDVRHDSMSEYRDDSGLTNEGLAYARELHADECRSLVAFLDSNALVELSAEGDSIPVRGNALASGDDAIDKACEDDILARLESGDVWAWAAVEVTASWDDWSASDYLGACSYDSKKDFRQSGGYYDDMRETALRSLAEKLEEQRSTLNSLFADELEDF